MFQLNPLLMQPHPITPLSQDDPTRPVWSVMVPTYNPRAEQLEQALRSVLTQAPGLAKMQIEVVDDCSPDVDVAALVRSIAGDRVTFSRNPENLGLARSWNRCIERAHGHWVHILHQDDYVLPSFYTHFEHAAANHPDVSFIASRCFLIDAQGIITTVTERLPALEAGSRDVTPYLYVNPFRCPAVAIRRSFFEAHGAFRTDLAFTLDWEMWIRAIAIGGGVALPQVLASFRHSFESQSVRLAENANTLNDRNRLTELFAKSYPEFDRKKANHYICLEALSEARRFAQLGNEPTAAANLEYYRQNAPIKLRLFQFFAETARQIAKAL